MLSSKENSAPNFAHRRRTKPLPGGANLDQQKRAALGQISYNKLNQHASSASELSLEDPDKTVLLREKSLFNATSRPHVQMKRKSLLDFMTATACNAHLLEKVRQNAESPMCWRQLLRHEHERFLAQLISPHDLLRIYDRATRDMMRPDDSNRAELLAYGDIWLQFAMVKLQDDSAQEEELRDLFKNIDKHRRCADRAAFYALYAKFEFGNDNSTFQSIIHNNLMVNMYNDDFHDDICNNNPLIIFTTII